jgi:Dockerin type I domain
MPPDRRWLPFWNRKSQESRPLGLSRRWRGLPLGVELLEDRLAPAVNLTINDVLIEAPDVAQQVSGALNPGTAADTYRFTGLAGDRLTFDWLTGSGGSWYLFGPGNQTVGSQSFGNNFTVTLPTEGSYSLLVEGGSTTLTWTLQSAIQLDRVSAALRAGGLREAAGNFINGGVDYRRSFAVLLGDYDGDGKVTLRDASLVRNAATAYAADPLRYNVYADLNGDGRPTSSRCSWKTTALRPAR